MYRYISITMHNIFFFLFNSDIENVNVNYAFKDKYFCLQSIDIVYKK